MNIFNFEWLLSFNNAKKDSFELFLFWAIALVDSDKMYTNNKILFKAPEFSFCITDIYSYYTRKSILI